MSLVRSVFPWPGPGRITLVLLALIPAAMAYPWSSVRDRWLLGVAVVVAIALLGWRRGSHLTTILWRRVAMLRHGSARQTGHRRSSPDTRTTALLRVVPSDTDPGELPLALFATYLHRYGLRADSIRVTGRSARSGTEAPQQDTWIGLTLSATENLAALRARSPRIPLHETTAVAVRRLADHLREIGWETVGPGADEVPELFSATARESWHAVGDGNGGYVSAYRVGIDHALPATLSEIWSYDAPETWMALEMVGAGDHVAVAAGCAIRTEDRPVAAAPVPGLIPQHGNHHVALHALQPSSGRRLSGHTEVTDWDIAALHWPIASQKTKAPAEA